MLERCSYAIEATKKAICWPLVKPSDGLEPSTPSLPWRFPGVTRGHARSLATRIVLQTTLFECGEMRRETSRVSFLMCPFCVRASLSDEATAGHQPFGSRTARRTRALTA
jgi:hypothetical protein